jgi:tRNA threonylcarbamoyl adenosine modification protein (Sua5/YciO/YrdC/YwlC family)
METRYAQVHGASGDLVRSAAYDLARGAIVAFPTECVYGLAARADDPAAVERLFEVKERPADRRVARLLARPADLDDAVDGLEPIARRLRDRLWPGPLTLVVRDRDGDLAGFRHPDHEIARELAAAAGVPVVQTSANRSGSPPAVDAEQVRREFDGRVEWILDGGPARYGEASSVVRVEAGRWEILREGVHDRDAVANGACERILFVCTGNLCRSPMAEWLLLHRLADRLGCAATAEAVEERGFRVDSAGTYGLEKEDATPEAKAAVHELVGVLPAPHPSKPITPDLADRSDRILVMTETQRKSVLQIAPDAWQRVALLDEQADIPDPYMQSRDVYDTTARHILGAVDALVDRLVPPSSEESSR